MAAGDVSDLGISKESFYNENWNREESFARRIVGYLPKHFTGHSLKSVTEYLGAGSGSHQPGRGETGKEIAGRQEIGGRNNSVGRIFRQAKKTNIFLIMPDNHIKGTS
jgi:hypothetical protein